MISVYLAQDLTDAELVRSRLSEAGIQTSVKNIHLQGALGELPVTLLPEVCVLFVDDLERARELVAEMDAARKAPEGPEVECAACGEANPSHFELCWSCRSEI